jgi:hypothetical protein
MATLREAAGDEGSLYVYPCPHSGCGKNLTMRHAAIPRMLAAKESLQQGAKHQDVLSIAVWNVNRLTALDGYSRYHRL